MTDPDPSEPIVEREEAVVEETYGKGRAVSAINGIIRFVTGLFALVLVVHIILVLAEANFGNAFAGFIRDFAANVNLGLNGLFTFDSAKLSLALNEGLAALLWLIIGAGLTVLIARIFLPGRTRVLRRRIRS